MDSGIVDDYSQITIDIVICAYTSPNPQEVSHSAMANYVSKWQIGTYYMNYYTIADQLRAFPEINYRFQI